jgi:hypothetical protein
MLLEIESKREMLFGHNTDVKVGEAHYHVQTEDRGVSHAIIDTTVYFGGRVLHRRTNSYKDLLPLDAPREDQLRKRVDGQHYQVLEELRGGTLKLPEHAVRKGVAGDGQSAGTPAASVAVAGDPIALELRNAKNWLAGKRATLQICVFHKESGAGVSGAKVAARIEGAAAASEFVTATDTDGNAQLAFDMPRLAGADCALVIQAASGQAQAALRFQLRAKPKVPTAG